MNGVPLNGVPLNGLPLNGPTAAICAVLERLGLLGAGSTVRR
jgi:hypothetical protein